MDTLPPSKSKFGAIMGAFGLSPETAVNPDATEAPPSEALCCGLFVTKATFGRRLF
jgi:hypothetical protein